MIAYIEGKITYKSPTNIIIDINGLGYSIFISLQTYSKIESWEKGRIYTHLLIKEDSHSLYGFADMDERSLFLQLISVSGIGASTAQLVLSSLNSDQIRTAIMQENDYTFSKVKGIGPKTAKRIILDLKDKIMKEPLNLSVESGKINNTIKDEALSALLALGFQRQAAQIVISKILQEHSDVQTVEDLIKRALGKLSS
ncbi:MAG TPA: Holliday junction branch migration protein RuvA [Saprospiraceae bacterium]|nr:Holliday junction branch migration protein RuvA [Saprospiraceae bacterium]